MLSGIKKSLNKRGFIATLQIIFQRIIGIEGWRDELDTLHFFLNAYHDTSCAPPSSNPDLRIMQQCDAELLRIFTRECDRLGFVYWLDYGTLLGAVRHKGFIPWDDDMDIGMPRSDYNRVFSELKDVLSQYDIDLLDNTFNIGVGYKHHKTGIWLDIFAVDNYFTDKGIEESIKHLNHVIPKYRKYFSRHLRKATIEQREIKQKSFIGGEAGSQRILYHEPEFPYKVITHPEEIVFPLSKIVFEGYSFNAPKDVDAYLKLSYGPNYMGFPRTGVLHHDKGGGSLFSRAKKNNVDMNKVLLYLKSI